MSKVLLVLTEKFPYENGETFLESEIDHWNCFDRVLLCPLSINIDKSSIRDIKCCELVELSSRRVNKLIGILKASFKSEFWSEVKELKKKSNRIAESFSKLIGMTVNMDNMVSQIDNYLVANIQQDDELYLYAYWLYNPAYVAACLSEKKPNVIRAVSRAHGFDVYEFRSHNYLPYRKKIFNQLDGVYCVSKDGTNYLKECYPEYASKFRCAYHGTTDYGAGPYKREEAMLRLVSCSNCIKIKRLDLIIDALSSLNDSDIQVSWTHYGGGPLIDDLKLYAQKKLKDKIRFEFKGVVANSAIMIAYKNVQYDLFINVSKTEGIPVSIMEAMSFGIPAMATNVGGTSELVLDGINGFLLDDRISATKIAEKLLSISRMDDDSYLNMRSAARQYWNEKFNSKINYAEFVNHEIM